jgi:PPM family protein phosphatase
LHIECAARSDQGRIRTTNEDSCIANPDKKIFIVADGMGGHAAGEIASQITAKTVEEILSGGDPGFGTPDLLRFAIQEANTRVFETQKVQSEYRGMGSTLTALTFTDQEYHIAQVGDSRAYLLRNKMLSQLTRDHSLVWPLFESGLLTKDDISRHPQKNLITRSIGTQSQVEPELEKGDALQGDIFLLCSDGLTDVLKDRDIMNFLSEEGVGPQEMSERLIQAANTGGGPDNVTVVLVYL